MGNAKLIDEIDDGQVFADELSPGSQLMHGQYTIESFLNAGGFGITYSARDSLDRRVVIKECFPGAFCRRSRALVTARSRAHQNELASIVRLFVQEARSLAKLNHPNIVGVHQVFEENDTAYMALDYIEGRDLLDVIDDENWDLKADQVENILRKVLDAVGFIHNQGILHRDISPDNILIDNQGEPVLIDFGAAREQATKQSRVLSALRVVKDGYSPQEFYITGSEQGPYSDLYALGASFYHLIAGDLPPNSQARLSSVATGEGDLYQKLAGQHPEFKPEFLESIDKALEILPKDRIESATHWLAMIDGKPLAASPAPVVPEAAKAAPAAATPAQKPKSKKGLLLASVALVALVGVAVVATQTDILGGGTAPAPAVTETGSAPVAAPQAEAIAAPVEAPQTAAIAPAVTEPAATEPTVAEPVATAPVATAAAPVETAAVDPAPTVEEAPAAIEEAPQVAALPEAAATPSIAAPTPVQEPSANDLVIGSADLPDTSVEVWSPNLPVFTPSSALALPSGVKISPEVESAPDLSKTVVATQVPAIAEETAVADTEVVASLPRPDLEVEAPALAAPQEEIASATVTATEDAPVDLFRQIIGAPSQPDTDVLTVFDTRSAAAPVAPVTDVFAIPGLEHSWAVMLPLRGLFDLGEGATRIYAVNGIDVDSQAAFDVAVAQTEEMAEAPTVTLSVKMGTSARTAKVEDWTLPVAQATVLANGWAFETAVEDEGWVTRVTDVPGRHRGDIRPGDIVYGFIPEAERLDQRSSLLDIFVRESEAGNTQFNFAIKRGDLAWAATIQFESARYASGN